MEGIRPELKINPDSKIRVAFEGEDRVPVFECITCENLLFWSEERQWWQCSECGYELTPGEAELLLDLSIRRLRLILRAVRKKQGKEEEKVGRWVRVKRWFARLFRRSKK